VALDLLVYCYRVCLEICAYLGVELFRIPYGGGGAQKPVYDPVADKNGTKSNSKAKTRSSAKKL